MSDEPEDPKFRNPLIGDGQPEKATRIVIPTLAPGPPPEPKRANHFDVLRVMGERNLDIRLAPLSNVIGARKTKAGVQVAIGVGGDDVLFKLANNLFVGGLILADCNQFEAVKKELEAAMEVEASRLLDHAFVPCSWTPGCNNHGCHFVPGHGDPCREPPERHR